ncbi:hypothetical protein [Methanomethylovorans sp.]|uniref:hypothetical protein n=1 Tax=Methanomethylovorans sp. TaxID=2758717 RepID=UPI003D126F5C
MKSRIGSLLATMMLLVTITIPATACVPSLQTTEGAALSDDFNIETKEGLSELSALLDITLNEDARTVIKDLQGKGYTLQYDQMSVQTMTPKEIDAPKATIVVIPAESTESEDLGQVIFVSNGERTITGNAIIELSEDYGKMTLFEINDGVENNYVVENKAGAFYVDGKLIQDTPATSTAGSSTQCNVCMTVCSYVYGAGCGLTGYATCTLGCAVFSGPAAVACPPICAVVFAALCIYGTNNSCPILCSQYC